VTKLGRIDQSGLGRGLRVAMPMRVPGDEGWVEADLDELPDDGNRYELIDGSLHVTPPPAFGHNGIGLSICTVLQAAEPADWGVVYESGIRLPAGNVIPDVVALRPGFDRDATWRAASEVALAVEIESKSSRRDDRREKPGIYAEAGTPAYWRVERHEEGPHLHAYELVDGEYVHVAWVRPGVAWQATSPYPVLLEPGTWGS
jgi:Uma2 family endonuclease